MLKHFSRKVSGSRGLLGLCQTNDGFGIARVIRQEGSKPRLTLCDFLPGDMTEGAAILEEACRRCGLSSSPAVYALDVNSYQLLQVVPPEVPEGELREALRWQVRDLIDFPLEEAVIDVFHVSRGQQREGARTAYVVVARQTLVRQRAAAMTSARLKVQAIDIPELVLRNLANLHPDAERGVALLYFGVDSGLIIVTRGQELRLARSLPFGTNRLTNDSGPLDSTIESIALEIQRSLDFYERSFAQVPIGSLVVSPQEFDVSTLIEGLRSALGIKVSPLELNEILECPETLPQHAGRCLLAIGAALRNDKEGQ